VAPSLLSTVIRSTQYFIGNMMTPTERGDVFTIPVTGGAGPCPNGECGLPTESRSMHSRSRIAAAALPPLGARDCAPLLPLAPCVR
jgi:hypothetical protein